jgi:hypothetical protein
MDIFGDGGDLQRLRSSNRLGKIEKSSDRRFESKTA